MLLDAVCFIQGILAVGYSLPSIYYIATLAIMLLNNAQSFPYCAPIMLHNCCYLCPKINLFLKIHKFRSLKLCQHKWCRPIKQKYPGYKKV